MSRFIGVQGGLSANRPTASVDGFALRAPIIPASTEVWQANDGMWLQAGPLAG
jgi:hypothetical protein